DMGSVPLREVAVVALTRAFGARGIDLAAIETGSLVRIAQQIVSRGDLLECFLGLLVAGIEVRVQLLGQFAVRFLYLLLRCLPFHSQYLIWVGAQRPLLFLARSQPDYASRSCEASCRWFWSGTRPGPLASGGELASGRRATATRAGRNSRSLIV